jgi:hypothetical protein
MNVRKHAFSVLTVPTPLDAVLTRSLLVNMTSTDTGRNYRVWATSCQSSRCLGSTVLP